MKVSLFVTCLVDQLYPQIGTAMAQLLMRLGVEVSFNAEQGCCGQPAFNSGYRTQARAVARDTLEFCERELETCDFIVVPSGSCATMVKKFYAELFRGDEQLHRRAESISGRVYELSQFLVEVLGQRDVEANFRGRVTYHDACHLLRELGVGRAPRTLIEAIEGAEFVEMERADQCCGFGGTFAINFPEISTAMAEEKVACIERSGAEVLVACDAGCLMQLGGLLSRRGSSVRCLHLAELLVSQET
jgi:L-lactate dehydrogenase complex protein LldE